MAIEPWVEIEHVPIEVCWRGRLATRPFRYPRVDSATEFWLLMAQQ